MDTGLTKLVSAPVLISALGFLEVPNFSTIPGIHTFKGEYFHSARWKYDIELRNRRVAVIGNGASSTQFLPAISKEPSTTITQFCRTPNYLLPHVSLAFCLDFKLTELISQQRVYYSAFVKWAFRWVPLLLRVRSVVC